MENEGILKDNIRKEYRKLVISGKEQEEDDKEGVNDIICVSNV